MTTPWIAHKLPIIIIAIIIIIIIIIITVHSKVKFVVAKNIFICDVYLCSGFLFAI